MDTPGVSMVHQAFLRRAEKLTVLQTLFSSESIFGSHYLDHIAMGQLLSALMRRMGPVSVLVAIGGAMYYLRRTTEQLERAAQQKLKGELRKLKDELERVKSKHEAELKMRDIKAEAEAKVQTAKNDAEREVREAQQQANHAQQAVSLQAIAVDYATRELKMKDQMNILLQMLTTLQ